jgi:AraC-like DNA-binding protein
MEIIVYIIALGILQGIILGAFLLTTKRGNLKANRILGALVILFSFSISHAVLYPLGIYQKFPHLLMLNHPILFLFGPLFYFYQRTLIDKSFNIERKNLLHFLPFVIYVIILSPLYLQSAETKLEYLNGQLSRLAIFDYVVTPTQIIQLLIYLLVINKELKLYHSKIKNSYSSLEKINLNWLQTFIKLFLAVYGLMTIVLILLFFGFNEFVYNYGAGLIGLIATVSIYAIGYKGLSQPEIFISFYDIERQQNEDVKIKIDESQKNEIISKLKSVMNEKKLFLNSDLTLKELADSISIQSYQLSKMLNDEMNQNFYDFVNGYRIEEVKRRLIDEDYSNLSILGIAFECGFNSKSVFNTVFKKNTNMTPSEFKKFEPQKIDE